MVETLVKKRKKILTFFRERVLTPLLILSIVLTAVPAYALREEAKREGPQSGLEEIANALGRGRSPLTPVAAGLEEEGWQNINDAKTGIFNLLSRLGQEGISSIDARVISRPDPFTIGPAQVPGGNIKIKVSFGSKRGSQRSDQTPFQRYSTTLDGINRILSLIERAEAEVAGAEIRVQIVTQHTQSFRMERITQGELVYDADAKKLTVTVRRRPTTAGLEESEEHILELGDTTSIYETLLEKVKEKTGLDPFDADGLAGNFLRDPSDLNPFILIDTNQVLVFHDGSGLFVVLMPNAYDWNELMRYLSDVGYGKKGNPGAEGGLGIRFQISDLKAPRDFPRDVHVSSLVVSEKDNGVSMLVENEDPRDMATRLPAILAITARLMKKGIKLTESPPAGLEEAGTIEINPALQRAVDAIRQLPSLDLDPMNEGKVLIFTKPDTFSLVPIALQSGWRVVVNSDVPEIAGLRQLLIHLEIPEERYAIGTTEVIAFLDRNKTLERVGIWSLSFGLQLLGFAEGLPLPAPVGLAIKETEQYLRLSGNA